MIKDFFKLALINISHRKKRSWLTVIGILIGIAAVISLISVSLGMQEAITGQFERLGADNIIIMAGGGGMMGMGMSVGNLTEHDLNVVGDVRGVEKVSPMVFKMARVAYSGETQYAYVMGWPPDATWVIEHLKVEGRVYEEGDTYKAIIGYSYPQKVIFKKSVDLGDRIDIEGHTFKVVGVMEEIGTRSDDSQIYIPLDTARDIFGTPDGIDMIYARVREGYDPSSVADDIAEAMRRDRNLDKGEENFFVQTTEQIMDAMRSILGILQSILIGIAAISLLVGAVGIMNTMYTSVLERTREIGIMKAVGAQNHDIWALFLVESGIFGLIGGIAGCALGLGMAKGVEIYASYAGFGMLKASITPWLILLGLGLAFAIGALSGMLPARAAAKLKPADALRYE